MLNNSNKPLIQYFLQNNILWVKIILNQIISKGLIITLGNYIFRLPSTLQYTKIA
jgi:hypothetical protein